MLIPKTYPLLVKAVEDGTTYGYRRAHKHTDNPTDTEIITSIQNAIMYEIAEVFELVDPKNIKL